MRRVVVVSIVLAALVVAPGGFAGAPAPLTGEWIVVSNNPAEGPEAVWLIRPDGSEFHTVSDGSMVDFEGALSPDGTALALVANDGAFTALWLADPSGGNRVRITEGYGASPAWTPDARAIVYSDGIGIRVIGRDGQGDRPIAEVPGARPLEVAVSPDGTTVVFSAQIDATVDLYSVPIGGGEAMRLTSLGGAEPAWSPDGTRIVFRTFRLAPDGMADGNLWVMDPEGGDQRNLIPSDHNDFHPSWSPDGTRVVFEQVHNTSGFPILIHDLATATDSVLIPNPEAGPDRFRSPSWTAVTVAPVNMPVVTTTIAAGSDTTAGGTTTTSSGETPTTTPEDTTTPAEAGGGTGRSGLGLGLGLGAAGLVVGFGAGMVLGRRRALASLPPPPPPPDPGF